MSIMRELVDGETIRAAVAAFIATMSPEDKEMAKQKADKVTGFIEKFPDDLVVILYKDVNGDATAMLPNKKELQFTKDNIEKYNLSEIFDEAIESL